MDILRGSFRPERTLTSGSYLTASALQAMGGARWDDIRTLHELAKRSVVTIDYGLQRIIFAKPESFHPSEGATRLPLRFASITEIIVDASVDGGKSGVVLFKPSEFALDAILFT